VDGLGRLTRRSRLRVASLNTRGIPLVGSDLTRRYRAIAAAFEASAVDVVCLQEVLTYYHLRRLARRMPSFRHVAFRPSLVGPAAGVVTLSRPPVAGTCYHRFPLADPSAGPGRLVRFAAALRGALVVRLARPDLRVVNIHPAANTDGDWSASNRFYRLQQGQLAAAASVVRRTGEPAVICGDFNVARDSAVYRQFIQATGLTDAFAGRCPPTFRAEFLPADREPQCIDFILVTEGLAVADAGVLFAGKHPLPRGPAYVSDHLGLHAELALPR
jgi:sphingomyelin phosphodiesterase 2